MVRLACLRVRLWNENSSHSYGLSEKPCYRVRQACKRLHSDRK